MSLLLRCRGLLRIRANGLRGWIEDWVLLDILSCYSEVSIVVAAGITRTWVGTILCSFTVRGNFRISKYLQVTQYRPYSITKSTASPNLHPAPNHQTQISKRSGGSTYQQRFHTHQIPRFSQHYPYSPSNAQGSVSRITVAFARRSTICRKAVASSPKALGV